LIIRTVLQVLENVQKREGFLKMREYRRKATCVTDVKTMEPSGSIMFISPYAAFLVTTL
jgi:hypothetical protein